MDLRCSLLGHDFVDDDIERSRETHGHEEVTTLRQFHVCQRCGDRRLVSEKRHVRATPDAKEVETGSSESVDDTEASALPTDGGRDAQESDEDDQPDEGVEVIHGGRDVEHEEANGYQSRLGETPQIDDDTSGIIEAPSQAVPEQDERDIEASVDEHEDRIFIAESVETEYHCPSCGLKQVTTGSSLRAGDICPDCRGDYLEVREA